MDYAATGKGGPPRPISPVPQEEIQRLIAAGTCPAKESRRGQT